MSGCYGAGARSFSGMKRASRRFYDNHNDKILVAMPGVPHEMKPMFENKVLPVCCRFFPVRAGIH